MDLPKCSACDIAFISRSSIQTQSYASAIFRDCLCKISALGRYFLMHSGNPDPLLSRFLNLSAFLRAFVVLFNFIPLFCNIPDIPVLCLHCPVQFLHGKIQTKKLMHGLFCTWFSYSNRTLAYNSPLPDFDWWWPIWSGNLPVSLCAVWPSHTLLLEASGAPFSRATVPFWLFVV